MLLPLTYKPTNDLMFKKMMTSIGKEQIIEGFVHDVTQMSLTKIHPDNPYQVQTYKQFFEEQQNTLYNTIVDVAATTAEGIDIIIEMQVYTHEGFFERILNYWAAAFTKNHQPDHLAYKPVISIVVTNFQVLNEHEEFCVPIGLVHLKKLAEIYNKNHQPFERIYLINLKVNDEANSILNQWKNFFTEGIIEEKIAPSYLKDAYELLQNINLTMEERNMVDTMTKRQEIYESQLAYAKKIAWNEGKSEGRAVGMAEGIVEGRAEGCAEGRKEMIRSFAKKLSPSQIAEILTISIDDVETILNDEL